MMAITIFIVWYCERKESKVVMVPAPAINGKALPEKERIQLKNTDHLVAEGIYVIGTLAGWRSQLAIAAGSGAAVATDLLTLWNNGTQTHAHDSIR